GRPCRPRDRARAHPTRCAPRRASCRWRARGADCARRPAGPRPPRRTRSPMRPGWPRRRPGGSTPAGEEPTAVHLPIRTGIRAWPGLSKLPLAGPSVEGGSVEGAAHVGVDEGLVAWVVALAQARDPAAPIDEHAEGHGLLRVVEAGDARVLVEHD